MHLLVTNMASVLDGAGEIVIGRVPKEVLVGGDIATVMETIKRLPQKNLWSSRNLLEGGYAWYMPDDVESYEPHAISDHLSDNILVACVRMSNPNGQYRINATWRMEFYTPAQILTRNFTIPWSPASLGMFKDLSGKSATSANAGHVALVIAIIGAAKSIYSFYTRHSPFINKIASQTYSYVSTPAKTKSKPKVQDLTEIREIKERPRTKARKALIRKAQPRAAILYQPR
jgi:hypothetical protein